MSPEKGGALRTRTTGGRRAALALLFSGAIVAAPLVLLHAPVPEAVAPGTPTAGSELVGYLANPSAPYFPVDATAAGATGTAAATAAATTTAVPATTTTAVPATTVPPTTTAAPATTVPPTTTTAPPPPTTVAPVAAAPAGGGGSTTGEATWYPEAPPWGCASPTLPFGTEVQVTNDADGATTSCEVDDREAHNPGRVLDMSYAGFSAIADPAQGVVTVTITW